MNAYHFAIYAKLSEKLSIAESSPGLFDLCS